MQEKIKTRSSWGTFWRVSGIVVLVVLVAGAVLVHHIRAQLPPGIMQDIHAGIAARDIPDPDKRFEKYLEGRFGPQSDPANQRKAFMSFLDPDHIKALQFLVKHTPKNLQQVNINATAKWMENYRNSLSPEQRASMGAFFQSPDGENMLKAATSQYNSQDVQYRGQTIPVVAQLLTTIHSLKGP